MISFTPQGQMILTWDKPGIGKWYKRRLNKARRKAIKASLKGHRSNRALSDLESDTNYKGT